MIVVDTNIIGYLFLSTEYSDQVNALMRVEPDWVAPPLWQSELRNVLILYVRQDWLTLAKIQLIMSKAERLMRGRTYPVDSAKVLTLATGSSCSAYDCEFVALAREVGVPLVTYDRKIRREFSQTAVSPTDFMSRDR